MLASAKRMASALICSLFLGLAFFSLPASAEVEEGFSLSLSKTEFRAGDKIVLTLSYSGTNQSPGAFLVRVNFDPSLVSYNKTEVDETLKSQYTKTEATESEISSVYTNKTPTQPLLLNGEIFRYTFTAAADASSGDCPFSLSVEQIVNDAGNQLADDFILTASATVLEPRSDDCRILALWPAVGTLTPAFDPDILQYQLDVPYDVSQMTFDVETVSGATWKVNRKNLGAGGSSTDFIISATSEDKSKSQNYAITVNRAEKSASTKTNTGSSGSSKSSGNTKTSGKNTGTGDLPLSAQTSGEFAPISDSILYQSQSNSPLLMIESSGFTPFLWGCLGSILLILLVYLISLHLKLMILSKEEKLIAKRSRSTDGSVLLKTPHSPENLPVSEKTDGDLSAEK
ncbi:cadherin-like beta sandwich domain-containing protein [Scatolibacter rhodanostii]|uniref:cadherin-like beta sandwich domain-containing protein n=1 Tax=Scatolibacter rhodanostii TaxID=2014781 RepID=UPI000C08912A|nr:cadherin-like beta sandwich domain-containing protein [Scatolibacter rhodanostii]